MSHNNCSLYLCPASSDFFISDLALFIKKLNDIELIAQPLKNKTFDENSFFVGKKYLDYIAYMGCSPAIQFEASSDNSKFCYIKIHQFKTAQLIINKIQKRAPNCPQCKQLIKNWQQHLTDTSVTCELCKITSNLEDFNWRKNGAYAQLFIEITDIFPKEAIPQQTLLDQLVSATNTDWQYFYSCK